MRRAAMLGLGGLLALVFVIMLWPTKTPHQVVLTPVRPGGVGGGRVGGGHPGGHQGNHQHGASEKAAPMGTAGRGGALRSEPAAGAGEGVPVGGATQAVGVTPSNPPKGSAAVVGVAEEDDTPTSAVTSTSGPTPPVTHVTQRGTGNNLVEPAFLYKAAGYVPSLGLRMDGTLSLLDAVQGVPDCLKPAIVTMCTHAWVPVEECLADPSVVRRLIKPKSAETKYQRAFRRDCKRAGENGKINVGGASKKFPGWVLSDYKEFDVTAVEQYLVAFGGQGFKAMRSEHMFEHLFPQQVDIAAAMSYLFMAPGGHYRIAVPDGYNPDPTYQDHVSAGNRHQHKQLWTVENLPTIFLKNGYDVQMMENFDSRGQFYQFDKSKWNDEQWSHIMRVADLKLVADKTYGYTSLYFDAIKPLDCPIWEVEPTRP